MNGERLVQNIKALTAQKGLKMKELLALCGITSGALSQWKSGLTKPQLIVKRNQLLSEPTPTPPPDPAVMQKISLSDRNIRERYYELTRQERQMLWRNMVESIVVRENVVDITWRQS